MPVTRQFVLLSLLFLAFCCSQAAPARAAGMVSCPLTVSGATVPCPVPVPAYQFLQNEAVQVLAAKGYPADLTPKFARNAIRAYVFARLLGIIQEDPSKRSAEEQTAYDTLQSGVHRNERAHNGQCDRLLDA